jgi:hypothetical protein
LRRVRGHHHQDVGLVPQQLGYQCRKPLEPAAFMTVLNEQVLALQVAELAQPVPKCLQTRRVGGSGNGREIPHTRDFLRLLRIDRHAQSEQKGAQRNPKQVSHHGLLLQVC